MTTQERDFHILTRYKGWMLHRHPHSLQLLLFRHNENPREYLFVFSMASLLLLLVPNALWISRVLDKHCAPLCFWGWTNRVWGGNNVEYLCIHCLYFLVYSSCTKKKWKYVEILFGGFYLEDYLEQLWKKGTGTTVNLWPQGRHPSAPTAQIPGVLWTQQGQWAVGLHNAALMLY